MLTPYDWQQAIGHRAEFIESRLAEGAPVFALSGPEGIVIFTYRRYSGKIFEIYDQLAFAAIGQQSDIESLRVSSIDFAHQEGFQRSEQDVTLRRVVTAMSTPIKRAFADFSSAPFIVRCIFAEVCDTPEMDSFALVDYEGDFRIRKHFAYIAGTEEFDSKIRDELEALRAKKLSPEKSHKALNKLWDEMFIVERPEGFEPECVFIERSSEKTQKFHHLTPIA